MRAHLTLVTACALAAACAGRPAGRVAAVVDRPLPCRTSADVTWELPGSDLAALDRWCQAVGPPVVMTGDTAAVATDTLTVVSWNTHVGAGRLADLLRDLRTPEPTAAPPTGMILLLQEVYRAGTAVPATLPAGATAAGTIRSRDRDDDIVSTAAALGLSIAYVPSMRNGRTISEREDRGNAVLSTEPLDDVRAIELPFGRQRRVAVAATVRPRGGRLPPFQVVSVHLDTRSARAGQARALAASLRRTTAAGMPIVLGGDLNTLWGVSDQAYVALDALLDVEPCGSGRTNTWPWRLDVLLGWWRGRVDHVFSSLPAGVQRSCSTIDDRYGSDHRPTVLRIVG